MNFPKVHSNQSCQKLAFLISFTIEKWNDLETQYFYTERSLTELYNNKYAEWCKFQREMFP